MSHEHEDESTRNLLQPTPGGGPPTGSSRKSWRGSRDSPNEKFFAYNRIEPIGSVTAKGPASCFNCGNGETCKAGAIHMAYGPGTKITGELIPDLSKQPESLDMARALGRKLTPRHR